MKLRVEPVALVGITEALGIAEAMPSSVNGVGTGLVKASRMRTISGCPHFDAIEAVVFVYFPLIPYRVIHVTSIGPDAKKWQQENYRYLPLRFAPRIIAKALLNSWGNLLMFLGTAFTVLLGFASMNMERAFTQTDVIVLSVVASMVPIGLLLKAIWLALDVSDNRIKNIIGVHELGFSDPYYWPDAVAASFVERHLGDHSGRPLSAIAEQALREGDRSRAMLYARLALRRQDEALRARTVFDQIYS